MIEMSNTLYLDTHGGPVVVTLTGRETTSRQGGRFIEVAGWLPDPMYVSAERIATDPRQFERNTMRSVRP
jgi:hypothetical protein